MADERQTNNQGNSGDGKGGRKDRRGYLSRKKRGGRKSSGDSRPPANTPPPAPKPAPQEDAATQERRERRRRRRVRSRQQRGAETPRDTRQGGKSVPNDLLDMGDVTLKPMFIYTHVLRPAVREAFESRSEHFSKVTRKLEDFNIDLAPLFAERTETSPAGALAPLRPLSDFDYLDDEEYEEEYDDDDAEESVEYASPDEIVEGNLGDTALSDLERLDLEGDFGTGSGADSASRRKDPPHKYDKLNEE